MLPSGLVFDGNMNAKLTLGGDFSPGAGEAGAGDRGYTLGRRTRRANPATIPEETAGSSPAWRQGTVPIFISRLQ